MEYILEKRKINVEKNEDEICNFWSKIATAYKIWSQKSQSCQVKKMYFFCISFVEIES